MFSMHERKRRCLQRERDPAVQLAFKRIKFRPVGAIEQNRSTFCRTFQLGSLPLPRILPYIPPVAAYLIECLTKEVSLNLKLLRNSFREGGGRGEGFA